MVRETFKEGRTILFLLAKFPKKKCGGIHLSRQDPDVVRPKWISIFSEAGQSVAAGIDQCSVDFAALALYSSSSAMVQRYEYVYMMPGETIVQKLNISMDDDFSFNFNMRKNLVHEFNRLSSF